MLFDRFFKPKWQHSDPRVRRDGLAELSKDDPHLRQIASQDDDPATRQAALTRVDDINLLLSASATDTDTEVRDYATNAVRERLAGLPVAGSVVLPVARRLTLLEADLPERLLEQLAVQGREPEIRLAALRKIATPKLLCERAAQDPSADIRLEAAQQITDPTLLEELIKNIKGRDKRVLRIVRERLNTLQQAQRTTSEIANLCEAFEGLTFDSELGPAAAHFAKLEQQWLHLAERADSASKQRVERSRAAFLAEQQTHAQRRQQREQICGQLETVIANDINLSDPVTTREQVEKALTTASDQWQAVAGPPDSRLARRFTELTDKLRGIQHINAASERKFNDCQIVIDDASKLQQRAGIIESADVAKLRKQWQSALKRLPESLHTVVTPQFNLQLQQLEQRLENQQTQKGQELAQLNGLIKKLETALENGELKQSIDLDQQARELLDNNLTLRREQMRAIADRLSDFESKVNELRGWRKWSTDQAREQLCERIEALVTELDATDAKGPAPTELAREVRNARTEWKKLDKTAGPSGKAVWRRFDKACESAYGPAKAHFEEQATQRQLHLDQRTELCAELEQTLAELAAAAEPDWPALARLEQTAQNRWRRIGPVNRGDRKAIDKRFDEALQQIRERLRPRLEQELGRREALIARVNALAELEDLGAAIESTKQAQAEWKPQLTTNRRREQALWKQFRTACDAVFARRQAEREARDTARNQLTQRQQALCAELEALCELPAEQVLGARDSVQALQQAWDALATDSNGDRKADNHRRLNQRLQKALKRFDERCAGAQQQTKLREHLSAETRAELCHRLEHYLENGDDATSALLECQEQWDALPALKISKAASVMARYTAVVTALGDPHRRQALVDELTANDARKRDLCLRLEIATESPTPPEYANDRMQYQVARLSESMAQRDTLTPQERVEWDIDEIASTWFGLGSLPIRSAETLQKRFERALTPNEKPD